MHLYRLSLDPNHLFETGIAVNYSKKDDESHVAHLVEEPKKGHLLDRIKLHIARRFKQTLKLAWELEKKEALKEKVSTRNEIMRPYINPIFNNSNIDSEWLQEYFIPGERLSIFLKFLSAILKENQVQIFNASVRYVKQDHVSDLGYAKKGDRFAVVLFFNQSLQPEKIEQTSQWIRKVIDYLMDNEGSYYLPYQHFATIEQFRACYSEWKNVIEKKKKFDPQEIFSSGFYADYPKIPPHHK